ncbi:uncharacterized protein LOC101899932 [Musca domestica]|uniref:Uncharacterized protein LOC101899932 n=1 Tax=Musca domestica TaxID=7370 RepID=T1PHT4_MUSDO|nr:uncharacterized protein LOC101899932 [Musca domestica]
MNKFIYFSLIFATICTIVVAAPYQELPPRKGHVPVYIRVGDQPLSEVNPKLIEAFHEDESPKAALEDKTPEVVVPETHEEAAAEATENKDEITNADEVNEVDEATASDIAEFDVKPENQDEPAKEEEIKNESAENKDE